MPGLIFDTRSEYHNILVISVALLFTFAVFLLGGSWLIEFLKNPSSQMSKLALWFLLVVVTGLIVGRVRAHGVVSVNNAEIVQHQIVWSTKIPLKEIKSYEITNSLRTVAQNGVTVRVPRLLALVTLNSGKKVPLVISVLTETDREIVKNILTAAVSGKNIELTGSSSNFSTLSATIKAMLYFAVISAVIPLIVYGKK